jgi:hypothetical protein
MLEKWNGCLGLVFLVLGTGSALGKTLVVGKAGTTCPEAAYQTIGAAISAAASWDVIEICPALYAEQLVITKPLTLRGRLVNSSDGTEITGDNRALLQPALTDLLSLATEAVITVMNTSDVTIDNLAIDASRNKVASCTPGVAGIHFLNATGRIQNSAIFNAELANPLSCTSLPFGNGFGVQVDANQPGPFGVRVENNSIHDYTANGVQVNGAGGAITAEIDSNSISGIGPASGIFQFAIFVLNGAVGHIRNNVITEGLCGSLTSLACIGERSEGVTLRAVGDGTEVDGNFITNAQSGIFINGANKLRVTNNQIRNIDAMSGMDIQATASGVFTNSVIRHNSIFHVWPIDADASNDGEGCGINEYSGTGKFSGNEISDNTVSDAYCGVAHVTGDFVREGTYFNILYTELNADLYLYPPPFPPGVEP